MENHNTQTSDAVSWLEQYRKMRNFATDPPGAEMRTLGVDLWFDEPRFEVVRWGSWYIPEPWKVLCGKTLSCDYGSTDRATMVAQEAIAVDTAARQVSYSVDYDAGAVRAVAAEARAKGHTPDERIYTRALEICAEKPREERTNNE